VEPVFACTVPDLRLINVCILFQYRIITLEDVLEALLQEQIYDEADADGRINCIREEQVEVDDEDGFFYGMMA
jgi:hypothetical protein